MDNKEKVMEQVLDYELSCTTSDIDVVIPTYKPGDVFYQLLERLEKQTIKPRNIIVINTEEQYFDKSRCAHISNLKVVHIKKEEFDHGGSRNYAATLSKSPLILFMTQDALPDNRNLIEELIKPFKEEKVAVAYGRQLANSKAGVIERYTRTFNYPDKDIIKTKRDIERLGIKTYFSSNVCAVYRKDVYNELGGFVIKTIFNEDMIMASKVIQAGYSIYYASEAKVIHSHTYTYRQQFQRNFDLAVSQRQYREIFDRIRSEDEGIKLVKKSIKYLIHSKKSYLIPDLILQSGFKYMGFQCGKRYKSLPYWLILKCTMNQSFWLGKELKR